MEDDIDLSRYIKAGDTITWGQANSEPRRLIKALIEQCHAIGRTKLFLGIGVSVELGPEHAGSFDFVSYCGSGTNRRLTAASLVDILPAHYSTLPRLLSEGRHKVDVLLLQVPPPDEHGRFSLGMAREYLLPALKSARVLIGEVTPDAPWTHGGPYLRADDFAALVPATLPMSETRSMEISDREVAIGRNVAQWIDDGSVLQIGIGNIPEAVLAQLHDRRNLGVHSGAIGDGIAALCEIGVVTNSLKTIDRGVTVAGSLIGSARLRNYAHLNGGLEMRGAEYTHSADVLQKLDRFVALNSAVEVDLTGQVNCETVRGSYIGAVGGVVDFLRQAGAKPDGKPIIALPSTSGEHSRIVARLEAPVTVARSEPTIVVTEFGAADLRGKSLSQRARSLISVAHPGHREALERAAHLMFGRLPQA